MTSFEKILPRALREPPALDWRGATPPPCPKHSLLINPFYRKDPVASFGKHVLAPTLALTSIAGATPPDWSVRYWDENLLQGSPPCEPFPSVVGITVHLTFAKRAYELSRFYRERGAKVVLGGLPGKWARNASLARLEPACGRCGESYPPAGRATSACSTSFDALPPAIT